MPAIPGIRGYKDKLFLKEAQSLVKEKKADGYRAFLESYSKKGNKLLYHVIWY